jgi:shikimate kinase
MPGCGKTTLGQLISIKSGLEFFDSDMEIERAEGMTCAEIITRHGEESFRRIERAVVENLLRVPRAVISLGGGSIKHADLLLAAEVVVCYVKRPLTEIANTLDSGDRPLSRGLDDLKRLYSSRVDAYQKCSHFAVDNTGTPESGAAEILRLAKPYLGSAPVAISSEY